MALQILSEPSRPENGEQIAGQMRTAIEVALDGAVVDVRAVSPGHFEIDAVWSGFEGLSRVKQQQQVYAAIAHLMKGDAAPVHAVDRLTTQTS